METREKILENWESKWQYRDWYAVDNYNPSNGRVHRLYVGDAETACAMAAERAAGTNLVDSEGRPAEPGEFGDMMFYRATLIEPRAARDYLLAGDLDGSHLNELIPVAQAAKELGIARQSAYELVDRGVIPSEVVGGVRVGRYSVALRNAMKG